MRFHFKLAEGVDVRPLALALFRQPELWNEHRFRTTFANTPHADVDDIWLRFSDPELCTTTGNVIGDDRPVWFPAAWKLPEAKPIILDLMRRADAWQLDRVLVTRLRPGGRILPHADKDGDYVQEPDRVRFHVVVQGLPGSLYITGGETVQMRTGEVWAFNAHEIHEVQNNSADDRIHLLVDVRTWPR